MGTYNRAGLLTRTIESIQAQSVKDWELIIADDGSKDETPEVVKNLQRKDHCKKIRSGNQLHCVLDTKNNNLIHVNIILAGVMEN